jgi:putative spermidine/putrescine transport system ATP-binding protein/spermidine/putrescine transport system ATP-binding protein
MGEDDRAARGRVAGADIDVSLRNVSKSYGDVVAVADLALDVPRGAFFSLLGPSGCGKTTSLRIVAGFERPDLGDVLIRGRRVTDVPPYRRDYGMVFQNFALFPHMSIADNVAFGLRMRGIDRGSMKRQVQEALGLVKLAGYESRYPNQLSGGQQQRVALARALILRPAVLLLDEPLGSLDKKLREEMQGEIRDLQRQFSISTIFVTHDQDEALTMSDAIAVMNHGVIEQIGTPRDIFENPRTEFVARFMGAGNVLEGRVVSADANAQLIDLGVGRARARGSGKRVGEQVLIAVRPENIALSREAGDSDVRAIVASVVYHGAITHIHMIAEAMPLVAHLSNRSSTEATWQVGDIAYCRWSEEDTIVLADRR